MTDYIDIPLKFTNPPALGPGYEGLEPSVGFNLSVVESKLPKLRNRTVLKPKIDLRKYITQAVVDWVRIEVRTSKITNWQKIYSLLKDSGEGGCWVAVPVGLSKKSSNRFLVTIQQPIPRSLKWNLLNLGRELGCENVDGLLIDWIEVSVDWRPRSGQDLDRWRMSEFIRRHHLIDNAISQGGGNRPRCFVVKDGEKGNVWLQAAATNKMRRVEKVNGVTLGSNMARVRDLTPQSYTDRYNELGKPKSRSSKRMIPMSPSVIRYLAEWKLKCPNGPLSLVFPNGAGNIENHSNINQRIFKPLLVDNDIVNADGKPKFGFHALRHAAASLFIEQGWPAKKAQSILGHSSITMTMDVYGHLFESPEDDVEMFEKMEADLMAA